jgi:glycolate oxidase subunit GlcD
MRKILRVDEANRFAVVQTGVVNAHVSRAVASLGLHYVPDPSSQPTCTIGGNIAENAGGIHCLKYGTTTDHVLGARVVLAGGGIMDLGGAGAEHSGYDLLGVFVGSEGTFGIATEATLRLVPLPPSVRTILAEFPEVSDASHAVSAIIAAGVMPAGLEMMDREIIRAVEASVFAAGLSLDIGAALLIELDGIEAGIDDEADRVKSICLHYGARTCRLAQDENERKKLWAARKSAFGAVSRISPDSMIQDAVVPRSRLPEVLDAAYRIASRYELLIANVFHAGDGNLHPLICFDSRSSDQVHRVKEAGRELMETCVRAGGSITGEHGVGFDKRELLSLIFSEADMDVMLRVRAAFDPTGLCNPGKIIPMLRGCGEARAVALPEAQSFRSYQPASSLGFIAAGSQEAGDLPGPRASRPLGSTDSSLSKLAMHRHSARNGGKVAKSVDRPFDPDSAARQFSTIVGETNISVSPHLRDLTSLHPTLFPSALTVAPGSIEEVCEVMRLASSEGWSVVPAGAATWLDAGNPLKQINIIVSTQKLNRIIEHEPADLVAITEAGVSLREFNQTLESHGQWLAIDPPDDADRGRSTIGGVVATGLGGAQQFGYDAPRRHVIGMKIVLADGSLIKIGGRVVKNVAGYDLCKLFTGSYGTLGVIVEVNFKLRPVPFETRTILAAGKRDELILSARRVIDSRLFPVAVELLSPGLAIQAELSEEREHVLLIKFAGSMNAVNQQTTDAIAMMAEKNCGVRARLASDDASIWHSLASLPLRSGENLVWRVGLRPADLRRFLTKLAALDDAHSSNNRSGSMWHAGVGDGRIRVVDSNQQIEDETVARLEALRAEAQSLGSALIIENARTEIKNRIDSWGTSASSAGLMKRIKQQLDPAGTLSPGRFSLY